MKPTSFPVTKPPHVETPVQAEYSADADLSESEEELEPNKFEESTFTFPSAPLRREESMSQVTQEPEQEKEQSMRGRRDIRGDRPGPVVANEARPLEQSRVRQQPASRATQVKQPQLAVQKVANQDTQGREYRNAKEQQRHVADLARVKKVNQDHAGYLRAMPKIEAADLYDPNLFQKLSPLYSEVFKQSPGTIGTLSAARETGIDTKGDHPTYLCVKRLLEVQFNTVIQDAQNDHVNNEQLYYQPLDGKRMVFFHRVEGHWFLSGRDEHGQVLIMDSLYPTGLSYHSAWQQLANLYRPPGEFEVNIRSIPVQQQEGVFDCFYFSTAFAYHFLKGEDPAKLAFQQDHLRSRILQGILAGKMSEFPLLQGSYVTRSVSESRKSRIQCSCDRVGTQPAVACPCGRLFHKECFDPRNDYTNTSFICRTLDCILNPHW